MAATWSQVEDELDKVGAAPNLQTFCRRLIGTFNVATIYRRDVEEFEEQRKAAGVITKVRHSKIFPEEQQGNGILAWKQPRIL